MNAIQAPLGDAKQIPPDYNGETASQDASSHHDCRNADENVVMKLSSLIFHSSFQWF